MSLTGKYNVHGEYVYAQCELVDFKNNPDKFKKAWENTREIYEKYDEIGGLKALFGDTKSLYEKLDAAGLTRK